MNGIIIKRITKHLFSERTNLHAGNLAYLTILALVPTLIITMSIFNIIKRYIVDKKVLALTKILIFDEATSMIDSHTQSEIHEAITKIYKDLTVIVISQRLSTIVDCDRILVIDQGRVVAEGKHKNLITNCKIYKNLFKDVNKKIRL